jgi:hypothetical protein
MAYVYKHIRKDKNEPFYIGIGSDSNYFRANRIDTRNDIWNKIKSKTDILVEIVFDNLTWEEACEKEKTLIKQYGRINNKTGILANMTDGGEGTFGKLLSEQTRYLLGSGNRGKKRSEISKMKQSSNTKGVKKPKEHGLKIKLFRMGKTWDDEVKNKISENKKGKPSWNKGLNFSDETKLKMSLAKKGLNTGKDNPKSKGVINLLNGIFYDTLKDAAESINMNYSTFKEKIKNNKIQFNYI